ncbi:VOC family protein [Hymenobacter endophyticus]|uniref:VOC family protein n=1 Tax=Hymenobacter endophyticus TaxID=3076335 RepID=A0ABU3TGY7_9BACT|nr:hypothetical protein [Hymenobacter endophyticus]MDU0370624.1 hypothetical protein [Hymenobacter endophyticus]
MLQGLRTIVYPVGNLAEAKAWYSQVLEQGPYFDEPFYVGFNVGGYEPGLDPNGPVAGQCGPETYWGVSDADAAFARLVAHGAHPHQPVHMLALLRATSWRFIEGLLDQLKRHLRYA